MRALALALALVLPVSAGAASGKVTFLEGTATRTPAGGTAAPLAEDAEVSDGDTLETGEKSRLEVTLSDESVIRLDAKTKLVVDSVAQAPDLGWRVKLSLGLGQVWSKVTRKLGADAVYEVATERAVAGVRGTEFLVSADADHDFEVYEGSVEVVGRGEGAERWKIAAGKWLSLDRAGKAAALREARRERAFVKWVREHETRRKALRERLKNATPEERERLRERVKDRRERIEDRRERRR